MRTLVIPLLLFAAACSSGPTSGVTSAPGHGALAIEVNPNPIVATRVTGETYDFPFEIIVRETGGRPVNVTQVSYSVFGPGGFAVARDTWSAERIRSLGYDTSIPPNGESRYRFNPRKEVPDERLFGGVTAQLRVEGTDDSGAPTSATTVVTITR